MNTSDDNVGTDRVVWLGDSAASTFMGDSDEGMFDVKEICEPAIIENGKWLTATKIGKLCRTAHQEDGSTLDLALLECKCVPDLQANLFSAIEALKNGWKTSNKGSRIILKKEKHQIVFDELFRTDNGKLC